MPPEFFLDRDPGRRVAEGPRACGWIAHGLGQSWVPVSKDGRIRSRDLEIQPVLEREAVLFHLDDQQLRSAEVAGRLDAHREVIHRAVSRGGPAAYAVRRDRIERSWP
ncbi:toxin-antitoxin system, toxin component, PIN family protein [Streptomyces sp. enrichment culture]|uniref:PIN-like domain-containing protein n=1 Tax=Streptomyces sp. enrichment culture TaxID=1795815 RepID=UPI003F54C2F4